MEVMEAIRTRRSIRKYKPTPVPMEDIRLIVEAATWAPSGYNQQPWKFIVLQDQQIKVRMYVDAHRACAYWHSRALSPRPETQTVRDGNGNSLMNLGRYLLYIGSWYLI
jgi:nitroreductase